jgi:DNA-binding NtrC family response regulator
MQKTRALIVTADAELRDSLRACLESQQTGVWEADTAERGKSMVRQRPVDLLVVGADDLHGTALVSHVRKFDAGIEVVAVVGTPELGHAALAAGAYDSFLAPIDVERLSVVVQHITDAQAARERCQVQEEQLRGSARLGDLVTSDPRMIGVFHLARRLARYDVPVLITGEVGTGKESLARALHMLGRAGGPFVVLAGEGATPEDLTRTTAAARRGTLFIDGIMALLPQASAALITLLDRISSSGHEGAGEVRVIAACREGTGRRCAKGTLREDLYLRLAEASLALPPLRERPDDIVLIASELFRGVEEDARSLSREVVDAMLAHDWPGNVDELRAVLTDAAATASGRAIAVGDLPPSLRKGQVAAPEPGGDETRRLSDIEATHLRRAITETRGNKARAARILGLSRWALQRKLQKHGISVRDDPSG